MEFLPNCSLEPCLLILLPTAEWLFSGGDLKYPKETIQAGRWWNAHPVHSWYLLITSLVQCYADCFKLFCNSVWLCYVDIRMLVLFWPQWFKRKKSSLLKKLKKEKKQENFYAWRCSLEWCPGGIQDYNDKNLKIIIIVV